MKSFKRKTAAMMLLGVFTLTADANSWDKLLEASQKSKLKAELLNFQLFPVDASISSSYGNRIHPIRGAEIIHNGIDLAASENSPFTAVADGRVLAASTSPTFGHYVEIKHRKGIVTRYAHANDLLVKKGQRVKKGDVLGLVGKTGLVTGPHLHFEIIKSGRAIDPEQYILARRDMTVEQYIASTTPVNPPQIKNTPTIYEVKLDRYDQSLTDFQLAKAIEIKSTKPPTPTIKYVPTVELDVVLMKELEPNGLISRFPDAPDSIEPKWVSFVTNEYMWNLARNLKSDIGYKGHLKDVIQLIVNLNPDAFRDGNADFRYADKPLYLPALSAIEDYLPKCIQSDRPIWSIAQSLKNELEYKISIYQVMLAFVNKNEEAFVERNVHRRLAGVPLRVPTVSEILSNTKNVAYIVYKENLSAIS